MKKLLSLLLACTMACTSFTGVGLTSVSANNETSEETSYADFRAEALKNVQNVAYNTNVSIGTNADSNIIHLPQNYFTPPEPVMNTGAATYTTIDFPTYGFDTDNDEVATREFNVLTSSSSSSSLVPDVTKVGTLLGQNDSINLWYIDTGDNTNVLTQEQILDMKDDILATSKSIYDNMTNDIAKHERVEGVFSNYPYVGDVDFDGRINVLLYDIYGDGTSGSYTAGFFYSGDQSYNSASSMLPIDALHMDIGTNQGGKHLLDDDDKSGFYGTFAHEFQHLLFHNHIGWKVTANETTWINESLSGVADLYYATGEYSSTQTPDIGKFGYAIPNEYTYDFLTLTV